jgi:hypothetical protein
MLESFLDLSWNLPMAKPSKKPLRAEAPAPPEAARRLAPRRATANRRLRILERLTGLALAHIAREEGLNGAAHTTGHRADAGEPRDRSAGRLRPTAGRPAQRSDDRGVHNDDGGRSARDGSIARADGRTRPLSRLRNAAIFASCGRLAAAAPCPASTGIAGADGRRYGNFPGCKALKSHETKLESAEQQSSNRRRPPTACRHREIVQSRPRQRSHFKEAGRGEVNIPSF